MPQPVQRITVAHMLFWNRACHLAIIALSAAALLLSACRGTMVDCDKHDSMHPECRTGSCIAVPGNVCQR